MQKEVQVFRVRVNSCSQYTFFKDWEALTNFVQSQLTGDWHHDLSKRFEIAIIQMGEDVYSQLVLQ